MLHAPEMSAKPFLATGLRSDMLMTGATVTFSDSNVQKGGGRCWFESCVVFHGGNTTMTAGGYDRMKMTVLLRFPRNFRVFFFPALFELVGRPSLLALAHLFPSYSN